MLTHRVPADRQGYPSIPAIFAFNESFTNKEHPHIAYFADALELACEAYLSRKYGEMFRTLGSNVPAIRAHSALRYSRLRPDVSGSPIAWSSFYCTRLSRTVGVHTIVDHVRL